MFLAKLNSHQKELFRDMCIFTAFCDGDYADSEKALLAEYCTEMGVEYTESTTTQSIDEAIHQIVDISSQAEQRAIGFELMGMVMADGIYQPEEREIVMKYSEVSKIPISKLDEMGKLVEKIYSMNDEIKRIVFE